MSAGVSCVTTWLRRTSVGQLMLCATASLPSCNVRSHYDTGGVWSALRPLLSVLLLVVLGSWLSWSLVHLQEPAIRYNTVMEKLPNDVAKYLKFLKPHSPDLDYFTKRFSGMDFDSVLTEVLLIRSLDRHGMIEVSDHEIVKSVDIENPIYITDDGSERTALTGSSSVSYPSGFILTADGKAYHSEMVKQSLKTAAGIVIAAIFGGFFAWLFVFLLG